MILSCRYVLRRTNFLLLFISFAFDRSSLSRSLHRPALYHFVFTAQFLSTKWPLKQCFAFFGARPHFRRKSLQCAPFYFSRQPIRHPLSWSTFPIFSLFANALRSKLLEFFASVAFALFGNRIFSSVPPAAHLPCRSLKQFSFFSFD